MSEKSIRYIVYGIKAGLFILPALSLIVANTFFFPFITGKNFFFRIAVEILFFFWVFVACFDKNYRPKKSPILIALLATLFFLTLATIFGANPYRSFWSNYERMEGLVGHIHLFIYFLVLTGTLRRKQDWYWLFGSLVSSSVVLVIYGFLQFFRVIEIHQGGARGFRLDATLGNATYYAILLIFFLFLAIFSAIKVKNRWLRYALMFLAVLEASLVFLTATRGAILGLLGGIIIASVLLIILSFNQKKVRIFSFIAIACIFLAVSLFLLFKNSSYVEKHPILGRLAGISLTERTIESRFTIWNMSLKGFLERPILGWGPENFNIMWNKYYEPKLYRQEPWFDRAHNIIFDWLISAGILGFLAYWSVWAAVLLILIKEYRQKRFTALELALFVGLLSAYAFHNLFVFDNLTSYYLFFAILGYLAFRNNKDEEMSTREPPDSEKNQKNQKEIGVSSYLLIFSTFLVVIFSLYFINVKPILANRQLLNALSQISQSGMKVDYTFGEFNKVFAYNTFGSIEAREQLAGYAERLSDTTGISQGDKIKALNMAIEEVKKQVDVLPNDARPYLFLTSLYTRSGRFEEALVSASKALELSPGKQQIHFVIADVYLSVGQLEKAADILRKAYELDKTNIEAAKNFFLATILMGKKDAIADLLAEMEKAHGVEFGKDKKFINAYAKVDNYQAVKEIWLSLLEKEPNNTQYRISLAATYLQMNERTKAIKELEKTVEINPEFKQQADYFISEIRAGRNP